MNRAESADRSVQKMKEELAEALAGATVVPSNYPPEVEAALGLLTPPLVRLVWCALGAADNDEWLPHLRVAADTFIATIAAAPEVFFRAAVTAGRDTEQTGDTDA